MPAPRIRTIAQKRKWLAARQAMFKKDVAALATKLHKGKLTVGQWHDAMRVAVKDLHISSLVISKGGEWGTVTFSEWGRVGRELRDQYAYLRGYAKKVEAGVEIELMGLKVGHSEAYLKARSGLYSGNSNATFWRGMTHNLLPQVPGDGQTACKMNCGCHLRVEAGDVPGTLHVYWILNAALENCDDCVRLAGEWAPFVLVLPPEMVESAASVNVDLAATIIKVIEADVEWFTEQVHEILHGHRRRIYA